MRRSWRRIAVPALVLVLFAAVGAVLWVLTTVPSLTSDALTRALGRRVELAAIDVRPGLRLEVAVRDLRVHPDLEGLDTPILEAPRAIGHQSWARVLVGQLVPLDWELESPVLRVQLDASAEAPALPNLPLHSLVAQDARIEIDAGARGQLLVEATRVELARRALLPGVSAQATATVSRDGEVVGTFSGTFEGTSGRGRLSGSLSSVTLSRLAGLVELPAGLRSLRGGASGRFEIDWNGSDFRVSGDCAVRKLRARVEGIESPLLAGSSRLVFEASRSGDVLTFSPAPLELDAFSTTGTVSVDTGPGGRVQAKLEVADFDQPSFEPGVEQRARHTIISLLGLRLATWRWLDEHVTSGRFESAQVQLDLDRSEFFELLAFPRPLDPDEFRFSVRLRAGTFLPGPDFSPLEQLAGRFALIGDRFVVQDFAFVREGEASPRVDLEVDGVSTYMKLPAEERAPPEGPGVDLPGFSAVFAALRGEPSEGAATDAPPEPPAPLDVEVSGLWLAHPGLVFQIRDASGRLRFGDTGMVVQDARAVVSGGLARLDVDWRYVPSRVVARIRYVDGEVPPRQVPQGRWLAGAFTIPVAPIGLWTLRDLRGQVNVSQGEVRLEDMAAALGKGRFRGHGSLDLTQQSAAPIAFDLAVDSADAEVAMAFMTQRGSITGTASAEMKLGGRLSPDESCLRTCDLQMSVDLRDGTLVDMPIALQIARLPSLEGIRGLFGQALPYSSLVGEVALTGGILELRDFAMKGSQLRALFAGQIDFNSPELESDLLVALLFLQTLDRVIRQLPFVGKIILGQDGSLLTMTFRVRGPFSNPSVIPAPPITLQGAAEFTGGLLGRVRQMIPGLGGDGSDEGEPAAGEGADPGEAGGARKGEGEP